MSTAKATIVPFKVTAQRVGRTQELISGLHDHAVHCTCSSTTQAAALGVHVALWHDVGEVALQDEPQEKALLQGTYRAHHSTGTVATEGEELCAHRGAAAHPKERHCTRQRGGGLPGPSRVSGGKGGVATAKRAGSLTTCCAACCQARNVLDARKDPSPCGPALRAGGDFQAL